MIRKIIRQITIYSMIIPITILYIWLIAYHRFFYIPIGLPNINRKDYFIFGRHNLNGLSVKQKMFCWYCDYFNGVISYGLDLGGQTEKQYCPIKNKPPRKSAHSEYKNFTGKNE